MGSVYYFAYLANDFVLVIAKTGIYSLNFSCEHFVRNQTSITDPHGFVGGVYYANCFS